MTTSGTQSAPAEFTPSEAWIDEFTNQCTEQMRLYAKGFAARRLHGLGKLRGYVDDYDAREMVQDILSDTVLGIRVWDPAAKTLQQHVEDVISSRAKHLRDRAKKYVHHRVDAFDDGGAQSGTRGEMEASLQMDRDDDDLMASVAAAEVIAQLRALAVSDREVVRFLDAVEAGARTRDDITHAAKLSKKAFRNARGRLRRLADQLDQQTLAQLRKA
jgi:hypothetical protein